MLNVVAWQLQSKVIFQTDDSYTIIEAIIIPRTIVHPACMLFDSSHSNYPSYSRLEYKGELQLIVLEFTRPFYDYHEPYLRQVKISRNLYISHTTDPSLTPHPPSLIFLLSPLSTTKTTIGLSFVQDLISSSLVRLSLTTPSIYLLKHLILLKECET